MIRVSQATAYDLDTLLVGMTPETFPDEVDFGRALGREAW
jgi:antitoxin MazE